jgi:hypothetical protein
MHTSLQRLGKPIIVRAIAYASEAKGCLTFRSRWMPAMKTSWDEMPSYDVTMSHGVWTTLEPVGNLFWKLLDHFSLGRELWPRESKGVVLLGTTHGEELLQGEKVGGCNSILNNKLRYPLETMPQNTHTPKSHQQLPAPSHTQLRPPFGSTVVGINTLPVGRNHESICTIVTPFTPPTTSVRCLGLVMDMLLHHECGWTEYAGCGDWRVRNGGGGVRNRK